MGTIPKKTKQTNKKKHGRKYDHKDDVHTHAREACRLEHKLTSTSRVHPDKYACIHPKTKRPDKKQTQRHSNGLLSLREAVLLA